MKPFISIVCPVFNAEKFMAETLDTVVAQSYKDWELLVMDGGSKDGTRAVVEGYMARYPNIKFYSEPDEGAWDALWKGVDRAEGEFVTFTYASDGYINNEWLAAAASALKKDPTLSLAWGIPFDMKENGTVLGPHFAYAHFLEGKDPAHMARAYRALLKKVTPGNIWRLIKNRDYHKVASAASMAKREAVPEKEAWFRYWLKTGLTFPDANMIVSKKVFIDCTPRHVRGSRSIDSFHDFFFNFNARGYFAWCVPIPANYGRVHEGQATERRHDEIMKNRENYFKQLAAFREGLKTKKAFSFIDKDKKDIASISPR